VLTSAAESLGARVGVVKTRRPAGAGCHVSRPARRVRHGDGLARLAVAR